jgi:hypothetical protein
MSNRHLLSLCLTYTSKRHHLVKIFIFINKHTDLIRSDGEMSGFRKRLERKNEVLLERTRMPFTSYCYTPDYQSRRFATFLSTSDVDVRADLTLKQSKDFSVPVSGSASFSTERIYLTDALATANLNQFMSLLNYACYKHAYKRYGKSVSVIPVLEGQQQKGNQPERSLRMNVRGSNKEKRLHNHLLLTTPKHLSFEQFSMKIRECWELTDFGYNECQIQKIRDTKGCLHYNLKSGLDSVDLDNLNLS